MNPEILCIYCSNINRHFVLCLNTFPYFKPQQIHSNILMHAWVKWTRYNNLHTKVFLAWYPPCLQGLWTVAEAPTKRRGKTNILLIGFNLLCKSLHSCWENVKSAQMQNDDHCLRNARELTNSSNRGNRGDKKQQKNSNLPGLVNKRPG